MDSDWFNNTQKRATSGEFNGRSISFNQELCSLGNPKDVEHVISSVLFSMLTQRDEMT